MEIIAVPAYPNFSQPSIPAITSGGTGVSLWVLVLSAGRPHRPKPVPLKDSRGTIYAAPGFAVTLTRSCSNPGERSVAGNPKRILLTGGAGFIGSHVAEALLRNRARLSIVDNLDEFYSPAWKKANLESIREIAPFDFFDQDICAMDRLREIVSDIRPDAIIHLAARAGVRPSIEHPRIYEQVNVAGTVNLLELCREFHVSRLIFGSSSSVYGASSRAPFSEEQSGLRPISPYAATKLAGELFCYTYAHLYSLPVMALRFFTE